MGLTEKEQLFLRVSDERFRSILENESTIVHRIEPTHNDYGEFLFVTGSRPGVKDCICMTF